jgi:hypothetical protein
MDQRPHCTVTAARPDPRARPVPPAASARLAHSATSTCWPSCAEEQAVAADWRQRHGGHRPSSTGTACRALVLNAITDAWLRCDIHIVTPDNWAPRRSAEGADRRDGIFRALPATPPHRGRSRQDAWHNHRVHPRAGLCPVADGRSEYEVPPSAPASSAHAHRPPRRRDGLGTLAASCI